MIKQSKKNLRQNTKQSKKKIKPKHEITKLKFLKRDMIGEGVYSKVYKFRYGKERGKINNKYVVKKIKVLFLKKFYGEFANQEIITLFNNELMNLFLLSKLFLIKIKQWLCSFLEIISIISFLALVENLFIFFIIIVFCESNNDVFEISLNKFS